MTVSTVGEPSGAESAPAATQTRSYAVILYCARSGSTFLSHRLAGAHPRVAVIPEFRLSHMLLWRSEAEVRALGAEGLLRLMRDDVQFSNLEIAPDAVPALARRCAGRSAREILEAVVAEHLTGLGLGDRDVVVLKDSAYALNAERAREVFPELRSIHVVRDPRGVANSMMRTRTPYDGNRPMARGNVLHAARIWRDYLRNVARVGWPVHELSYERLIAEPEAETARIAAWLTGDPSAAEGAAASKFRVGAAERGMHRLAAGDGVGARTDAWGAELPAWQVAAVEAIAWREMARRGYDMRFGSEGAAPSLSPRARAYDLAKRAGHVARSAFRLAGWAVVDPQMARVRLRQYAARLRGRY